MKIIIIICLITLIRAQLSPENKALIFNATADIKKYHIYSYNMSQIIAEKMEICEENKKSEMALGAVVGIILLGIFAPIIAPAFAAKGLVGAAAVSNGLATLGGGALAVGGAGMLGGTIVLAPLRS